MDVDHHEELGKPHHHWQVELKWHDEKWFVVESHPPEYMSDIMTRLTIHPPHNQ
jgi:hypothetical protein